MGIRLIDAAVINHVYPIFAGSRSLIQLGRQSVLFSKDQILNLPLGDDARHRAKSIQHDGPLSDAEFFSINGFVDVKSMDVDGYENADYIYDMNDDGLPDHLREKFDFVLDGGTMEHVSMFRTF